MARSGDLQGTNLQRVYYLVVDAPDISVSINDQLHVAGRTPPPIPARLIRTTARPVHSSQLSAATIRVEGCHLFISIQNMDPSSFVVDVTDRGFRTVLLLIRQPLAMIWKSCPS